MPRKKLLVYENISIKPYEEHFYENQTRVCRSSYATIHAALPTSNRSLRSILHELSKVIRTHVTHPKRDMRGILAEMESIDTLGVRKNAGAGAPNCFLRKAYCDFAC